MSNRKRLLLIALTSVLPTCKADDGGGNGSDAAVADVGALPDGVVAATTQDVLAGAGSCALTLYRQFAAEAGGLKASVDAWAGMPADASLRAAAQQAWRQALNTWQQLEVFQFGPAAPRRLKGGEDLRPRIYSWPTSSRCDVESVLARELYTNPAILDSRLSLRGLDALEVLLFLGDTMTVCGPNDPGQAAWSMLDAAALDQRRAAYAKILVDEVLVAAQALQAAWEPAQGNFLAKLATPTGDPFGSLQMALNSVSDALFYVERETKDMKMAMALGTCATCTAPAETPLSATNKANVANNLVGFQRLFSGCNLDHSGPGFYQLLWSRNVGQLGEDMRAALTAAQTALANLASSDLATAAANERPQLEGVYSHLVALGKLHKTQFMAALNLKLPMDLESDND